jgi:LysM repeat protein
LSESFKICPICRASNHRNAAICLTCGTTLADTGTVETQTAREVSTVEYDYRYGESDLFEGDLSRLGRKYLIGIFAGLLVLMCGGLALLAGPTLLSVASEFGFGSGDGLTAIDSPTPHPMVILPTVTEGPPTLTPTNTEDPTPTPTATYTREPCYQEVRPGEGLINVVSRCGHVNRDVLEIVVELNNLRDVNSIQVGQRLEIPWPTETPDPDALPPEAPADDSNGSEPETQSEADRILSAFDEDFDPLFVPTATLPPGVQFHTVVRDENVIVISMQYGANVEILSQLNPEIAFSQCDFGQTYGGPRCTVQLREGQRIRVPAPTATPTLPPTPSGSETATPSPTPTFNAPHPSNPSNRAFYRNDQLVTLRWVPTGVLGDNQTYRIKVEDLTAGIVYTANTSATNFIIPDEWQGETADRHEYAWSVSVIDRDDPDNPQYTTETLVFFWEGRE